MPNDNKYWFPAKRYGWGWGLPTMWQGWVVMGVFGVLLLLGTLFVLPSRGGTVFGAYAALLIVVVVAICWAKGEPPGWHWGDK